MIQEALQAARQNLLQARINSNHYANEASYQEGLIKLLEAQLEDKIITGDVTAIKHDNTWAGQALCKQHAT